MTKLAVLCFLLLQTGVEGFKISNIVFNFFNGGSLTHEVITERAILNVTLQVCRALALSEGKTFSFPPQPFSAGAVAAACDASKSTKSFIDTIVRIQKSNHQVDKDYVLSPSHHCDDESIAAGQFLITLGLTAVKASNKQQNFVLATSILGEILHTLQDFYSHTNWVEIGNTFPNANLIKGNADVGKIAAKTRATCRNCAGEDCRNNILEDILKEQILTSGYFSLYPFSTKPKGKCSHGGSFDRTKEIEPTGGINKDSFDSEHGHLHSQAANMAIAATSELLEDVRSAAGDKGFLQMMGLFKGRALCFCVDTTGSMGDDIEAVRTVTSSIIDSKVGTEDEPSIYILVPFNDPEFGPLLQTTDPDVFKSYINSLTPNGGGDAPEMSLSGLQLALTGAPPNSEIFVFTDAAAKDDYLKNTVLALIEQTKSRVNFIITNVLGLRRRRQADNNQQTRCSDVESKQGVRMSRAGGQLYRDLAQASGGQAVEVTKGQLLEAINILTESTSSSLVSLLQASRNLGKSENFTFVVDDTVKNLTIYITGTSVDFSLISPSGVIQNIANTTGSSIISSQSVGNLQTVQLQTEGGLWELQILSTNPYSVKVVGESPIDFLFKFIKESDSPFGGFDVIDNRPTAGGNTSLLVTLIGSDVATVSEVTLVESSGSGQVNGTVEAQGGGTFIIHFDRIPSVEFVVLVKGQNNDGVSRASSGIFQRQSATNIKASVLTVTVNDLDTVLEPGTPRSVSFSVMTTGEGGSFTIQATNDQRFAASFPSSLLLDPGVSANGTVNITAPAGTPSGTGVTLTIEAVAPGGADTNYDVLRLTVLSKVTDFTPPVCQLLSLQSNCSDNCSQSTWEVSVQVTDAANGTGVDSVSFREGSGTMNTSTAADNTTLVSYVASCCSPDVQLVAVDKVGNVKICSYSVRVNVTEAVTTSNATMSNVTTSNVTTSNVRTSNVTTSPVTTSNVTTSPVTTSNVTTSPVTTSNVTTSNVTTSPVTTSNVTTSNVTTSPVTTSNVTTSNVTTSPVTTSKVTASNVTMSKVTTSNVTTSPVTTSKVTASKVTTSKVTTSNVTTSPVTTSKVTASKVTTSKVTTSNVTTSPVTTSNVTTSNVTTSNVTTSPVTTSNVTTSNVTTSPVTTSKVTTSNVTTSKVTTSKVTTSNVTTSPVTTSKVTASKVTTSKVTTSNVTTSPVTTSNVTTSNVTTSPVTTSNVTTSNVTTSPVTTSKVTTSNVTTSPVTTSKVAASNVTMSKVTTSNVTTSPVTTSKVTASKVTTSKVTTAVTASSTRADFSVSLCFGFSVLSFLLQSLKL
ncbi:LOW QUALITY PROTEIN: mucin-3A-like [Xiphophorus couchianus]|uniref:LOW QUALITY PROTEIN: mucin-3A-like n=1 Tax=Xiphophorus couchianus TaxID=32473 RepID=UPI001016B866|nr:LOW QUALITY PROTEIN: mucin-3A-like [Xiphophorus couchianus]